MQQTTTTNGGTTTTTETDPAKKKDAGGANEGTQEAVSRDDHERALNDMHKYKKEAAEAREALKKAEEAKLREQSNWKELAEKKEKEALDLANENKRIKESYLGEKKFAAVQAACQNLGIRSEALSDLEMLDMVDVTIETTSTGKINVLGATKFAERLKTLKPHWFAEKQTLGVNTKGQGVIDTNGEVTLEMLSKAEAEFKKTGDSKQYQELFKRYQLQRRKK